ncbi:MAG: NADH-quinone oxidoreductase subunit C [Candidatus Omnitrophica bacterium]|nr:NADH-quinone oxidoreductase subunit C [Candidatus Omnitrophota bacterium]
MKKLEIIENIKVRSEKELLAFSEKPKRIYFTIEKSALSKIAKYLFREVKARFITASGVDTRSNIEILYHFSVDEAGLVVSLRVILEKDNLEIESLTPIILCTEWIEREIHELLGVNFKGHPNLKHLLLKDDWPEGNYPLRRDQ